jgi:deferrochelatase/peroxidase EfeB
LLDLWQIYSDLKVGSIQDLPGIVLPDGRLTALIGYGRSCFAIAGVQRMCPADLGPSNSFRAPSSSNRLVFAGAGLKYADQITTNVGEQPILVQFIGSTALSVKRPVVETWKRLFDRSGGDLTTSPVVPAAVFDGFQREDQRSWIDFHDGVSNMESARREGAISIKPVGSPTDNWAVGGTYMSFLRINVDLPAWRALTRAQQETIVGRDKLSGCALVRVAPDGQPIAALGCPVVGSEVTTPGNEQFREPSPPAVGETAVAQSHVQRANHHVTPESDRNSLRIFRQGFEFLESSPDGAFSVGLNFVSFQDTPERLRRILQQPSWLGRINFGGDEGAQLPGMADLLKVHAAGMFLVPPVVPAERFPGESIFGS